jgi:hypothetical protein
MPRSGCVLTHTATELTRCGWLTVGIPLAGMQHLPSYYELNPHVLRAAMMQRTTRGSTGNDGIT